jgi:hypothetical protein
MILCRGQTAWSGLWSLGSHRRRFDLFQALQSPRQFLSLILIDLAHLRYADCQPPERHHAATSRRFAAIPSKVRPSPSSAALFPVYS